MDKTEKLASELFVSWMQGAQGFGVAPEGEIKELVKKAAFLSVLCAKVFYETFESEDSQLTKAYLVTYYDSETGAYFLVKVFRSLGLAKSWVLHKKDIGYEVQEVDFVDA